MVDNQASGGEIPRLALAAFFAEFLHGILNEGLMPPLKRCAESNGPVAPAARLWYEAMLAGAAPDAALTSVPFPEVIREMLREGIAGSALDYVVEDLLIALAADDWVRRLRGVLADYRSRPKGTVICVGCVQRDLRRLLDRAAVEQAVEVRVSHSGAHMEQQFAGVFPVRLVQPARPRVVDELERLISRGGEIAPGIHSTGTGGSFAVTRDGVRLEVKFTR